MQSRVPEVGCAERIRAYLGLQPARTPVLHEFRVTHDPSPDWSVRIVTKARDEDRALSLSFTGVRDLKVDWPGWSVILIWPIQIEDVSTRGLENINYRVQAGEDDIKFWCQDFMASLV